MGRGPMWRMAMVFCALGRDLDKISARDGVGRVGLVDSSQSPQSVPIRVQVDERGLVVSIAFERPSGMQYTSTKAVV